MPTYEYACSACGHAWEEVQRITEPPVDLCPSCKRSSAHRLISGGTNFILKGGGWYSDLYASPKPAAKKQDEGAAASPSASDSGKAATEGSSSESAKPSPPSNGANGSSSASAPSAPAKSSTATASS